MVRRSGDTEPQLPIRFLGAREFVLCDLVGDPLLGGAVPFQQFIMPV